VSQTLAKRHNICTEIVESPTLRTHHLVHVYEQPVVNTQVSTHSHSLFIVDFVHRFHPPLSLFPPTAVQQAQSPDTSHGPEFSSSVIKTHDHHPRAYPLQHPHHLLLRVRWIALCLQLREQPSIRTTNLAKHRMEWSTMRPVSSISAGSNRAVVSEMCSMSCRRNDNLRQRHSSRPP
jgi:hypothetical protein